MSWFLVRNMEVIEGIPEDFLGCTMIFKKMVLQGDLNDYDILEVYSGNTEPLVASVSIWKRLFKDPDFSIGGVDSRRGDPSRHLQEDGPRDGPRPSASMRKQ